MAPRLYRIIEHTADTGFEVRGATKEQVYENAAKAFFDIMWQIKTRRKSEPEDIEVSGIDQEELLVNFLEEFLYLYDAKRLVCTGIEVETVTDRNVCAQAWLQEFDVDCDRELLSVKAVTYHQLFLGQEKGAWRARIFLDI